MKKSEFNVKVLSVALILFGTSLCLSAQPHQRQSNMQDRQGPWMEGLELTEDQRTEIQDIRLDRMKESRPMLDEIRINRAQIHADMNKDDPDMKEIVSLVENNAKLITTIQFKKIESQIKVRTLLTDDQKVLYDARTGKGMGRKFQTSRKTRIFNLWP